MPWRGPEYPGEVPSLGELIGEWIEEFCIVPDGPKMGEPYLLTDEMWNHLLHAYRLRSDAHPDDGADAFTYGGSQLVRPQKWGKDPFMAARSCAHALGPVVFDGWDADGEPVGRPHPSAWIAIAATVDEQTRNTFNPIIKMLRDGPLQYTPGLDVGDTRVKLPGVGWVEPVTTSAMGRMGGRYTFVTITESGLLVGTGRTGGVTFVRVLKRNVAGMNGMWTESTNPWDPTEGSAAQLTYEAKAVDVFVDFRLPRRSVDLDDEQAVLEELRWVYGDSLRSRGGWVSERRILADAMNPATGASEVRRFFLNEITSGEKDAIDVARWTTLARLDDPLTAGEAVTVGFDGSRSRDATVLWICRIRDRRLFRGYLWVPEDCPDHRVPRPEVDQAVDDLFEAYDVRYMFADPYRWQDYLDVWAARYPGRVVEFPTNVERRMDDVIERFQTAVKMSELTHDGDPDLTEHAKNAALAKGKRKPPREDDDDEGAGRIEHYLRLVKKRAGLLIDVFVAAHLAYAACGQAIEDGALVAEATTESWGFYE